MFSKGSDVAHHATIVTTSRIGEKPAILPLQSHRVAASPLHRCFLSEAPTDCFSGMIVAALRLVTLILWSGFMALLAILVSLPTKHEKWFHAVGRGFGKGALRIAGVRLTVEGVERVDFSRPHIFVANHASLLDIPSVLAGIPDQIRIVYKRELERIPIFGWGLRIGKTYIAIDRAVASEGQKSLEQAVEKIRTGASVLLFAEGTRTSDGNLQVFKRGAFSLATRAGVPVVPLTINGSYRVLHKNTWRISPGPVTLILETPIEPGGLAGKSAELELRDRVRQQIEKHYVPQTA